MKLFWKIDYRNISLNALDAIRMYEEEIFNLSGSNGMTEYDVDDFEELAKYRDKIRSRMETCGRYGMDWYDAYKLRKWTKMMLNIMASVRAGHT